MRSLAVLTVHPLASKMPMLPADAPEMVALAQSIELHGLGRQPLLVNDRDQIMDGRHRSVSARLAGLSEVPCIVRPDDEAAAIIVESLIGRRHYVKGALAYLSVPLLEDTREAREQAQVRGLMAGGKPRASTKWTHGKTVEDLAEQLGFGRTLFFMAQAIHKKFESSDRAVAKWRGENPERAAEVDDEDSMWFEEEWAKDVPHHLRAEYEPKILSGERSLGDVQKAIAGIESTRGKEKSERSKASLFFEGMKTFQLRFGYWETFSAEEKQAATRAFADFTVQLPPDVQREIIATLAQKK